MKKWNAWPLTRARHPAVGLLRPYLLLLLRERLLALPLRLLPRAPGLLLLRLELLPVLRPLEAVPRLLLLLLLREDDEPDFEEEEELRDAIACSLDRLMSRPSLLTWLRPPGSI